jgi:hypothetical protein
LKRKLSKKRVTTIWVSLNSKVKLSERSSQSLKRTHFVTLWEKWKDPTNSSTNEEILPHLRHFLTLTLNTNPKRKKTITILILLIHSNFSSILHRKMDI